MAHHLGAPLGTIAIVLVAAFGVRMSGNHEPKAIETLVAQCGAQTIERDACFGRQLGGIVWEVNIEIDGEERRRDWLAGFALLVRRRGTSRRWLGAGRIERADDVLLGPGDTVVHPVRLVVGPPPGRLEVNLSTPLSFNGPQGGPFNPGRITFNMKVVGNGIKWSTEGGPA